MSEENVELARVAMSAAEAYWDLLDEYVVCDYRSYRFFDAGEVTFGREAAIEVNRRYWGTFADYSIEATEYLDLGESVLIVMREQGRGKASGIPVDRELTWIWTFRNGRIVRMEPFRTKEQALEAAGLAE
jgi:ketosteroid isomerase-like protein